MSEEKKGNGGTILKLMYTVFSNNYYRASNPSFPIIKKVQLPLCMC